jgi:hypothetical protein
VSAHQVEHVATAEDGSHTWDVRPWYRPSDPYRFRTSTARGSRSVKVQRVSPYQGDAPVGAPIYVRRDGDRLRCPCSPVIDCYHVTAATAHDEREAAVAQAA